MRVRRYVLFPPNLYLVTISVDVGVDIYTHLVSMIFQKVFRQWNSNLDACVYVVAIDNI